MAQIAGRYILGGSDSSSGPLDGDINHIDSYFVLDTQTGKKTLFSTIDQLRGSAQQLGINLNLQPIAAVYSKYRYTWFDIFVGILLCVPLLIYFVVLAVRIHKLRKSGKALPTN